MYFQFAVIYECNEMDSPRKMAGLDALPVSGVSQALYRSNAANRIAIFGTIPVATAPRPVKTSSAEPHQGMSWLTLVETERGFLLDNHCARSDETPSFHL